MKLSALLLSPLLASAALWLATAASAEVAVPVLRQDFATGEVIAEQDLRWISISDGQARGNIVRDKAALVDMAARRRLKAGLPLRHSDVEVPAMIRKNALVTMVLRFGALMLTAQGRAQENGAQGETIRLLNVDTRQVVEGRIEGPNLVLVAAPVRLGLLATN
ncbi:MAG: flagellar basal body P-ring formation chaperone FlgA [Pseudomonadota bacterium]